jgi:hypothetical protein
MRLRSVGASQLDFAGETYEVRFGKVRGRIAIRKGGKTLVSGSYGTTFVAFEETDHPLAAILPDLAVGLCVRLKNMQGLFGAILAESTPPSL